MLYSDIFSVLIMPRRLLGGALRGLLITLIIGVAPSSAREPWQKIAEKHKLSDEYVAAASAIFSSAAYRGLPPEILHNKFAEGLNKTGDGKLTIKVLGQKLHSLISAQKVIEKYEHRGMKVKSAKYCLKVFSDITDSGVAAEDIEEFLNAAPAKLSIDAALKLIEVYREYAVPPMPPAGFKQIFLVMLARGDESVVKAERIFQTMLDAAMSGVGWETIKEAALDGISKNRPAEDLKKQLRRADEAARQKSFRDTPLHYKEKIPDAKDRRR